MLLAVEARLRDSQAVACAPSRSAKSCAGNGIVSEKFLRKLATCATRLCALVWTDTLWFRRKPASAITRSNWRRDWRGLRPSIRFDLIAPAAFPPELLEQVNQIQTCVRSA